MQALRDDDFLRLNAFSAFIENFAAPSKRERLRFLLSKPTRRAEIPRLFHDGAILMSENGKIGYFEGEERERAILRVKEPAI